ncbi:MAG TPA: hypothetical protein VFL03_11960 [Candidatus Limnocylindrales bacterium]|nr:hypothetical protein [Candidatus Limnocylindrales bacterium]
MERLSRRRDSHCESKTARPPMSYHLLRVSLEGVDHFMLEVDADGVARREIGLDSADGVIYAAADNHGPENRCIWHQLFGWELDVFLTEDATALTAAQFEAAWAMTGASG